MFEPRVTVIAGGFGSGKTEIAVNGALVLVRQGQQVTLIDLDVVKPYFRCRSLHRTMAADGVPVLAPDGECMYETVPVLPSGLPGLLQNRGEKLIVDLGGDPVGALVFGAVAHTIPDEDMELLVALNFARPQTEKVPDAVPMIRAIEAAARVPVRGLIANTHLLGETTPSLVLRGLRLTEQTAAVLGVQVALAAVDERLIGSLPPGWADCPVLPLRRMVYPPYEAPKSRAITPQAMLKTTFPVRPPLTPPLVAAGRPVRQGA